MSWQLVLLVEETYLKRILQTQIINIFFFTFIDSFKLLYTQFSIHVILELKGLLFGHLR
jgi:hypothetical protein